MSNSGTEISSQAKNSICDITENSGPDPHAFFDAPTL
jgi:hypothetical protein